MCNGDCKKCKNCPNKVVEIPEKFTFIMSETWIKEGIEQHGISRTEVEKMAIGEYIATKIDGGYHVEFEGGQRYYSMVEVLEAFELNYWTII